MSEGYGNGSVGSSKYRTPAARPSKGKGAARVMIVLLVLALLAVSAAGVFLLRDGKPFASYGDTGSANVMELQQWLARLGCYDGNITGDFDTATYDAYWDYCTAHGLTPSRDRNGRLIVSLEEFEGMTACTAVPTATPSPTPTATPESVAILGEVEIGDYDVTIYADNTCHITKYRGNAQSLRIPDTLNGYRVTAIGRSAFVYCHSLTSVTIPDSVLSIDSGAFQDCDSLTAVSIPDSVSSIGFYAFYDCDALTAIAIPSSVTHIGNYAFCHCNVLSSVTIPDSVTSIGYMAFAYCTSLTSVSIPNSVTSIKDEAFSSCPNLTLRVPANSYAEQYAIENSLPYTTY